MEITHGKIGGALKFVVYGPEGIGKTTFASQFPSPLFIDTEGSTKFIDVARTPAPSSWTMIMEQVQYVKSHPSICGTLVVDTADWAEQLCVAKVCADYQKKGIEDFGYGKGYTYLSENFGRLLNLLEEIVCGGTYVVLNAHAKMRKFEQPDELGAYDRWELKLQKTVAPLVKEWADIVLFANYKTYVVNVDDQGAAKGKNKAQGGRRVMYTTHHPCWDAKNRHGLREELPFSFDEIAHLVGQTAKNLVAPDVQSIAPAPAPIPPLPTPPDAAPMPPAVKPTGEPQPASENYYGDNIPKALADLMRPAHVMCEDIQKVVAQKGYYPAGTPIENYDTAFVNGVLIGAWPQVLAMIEDDPNRLPF